MDAAGSCLRPDRGSLTGPRLRYPSGRMPEARSFDDLPRWEQRFRGARLGMPTWSRHAPDRVTFTSTESGSYQLFAWDRATGMRRRVTDNPVGITDGTPTADGSGVLWFDDTTGDESGRWMHQAFAGGDERPFLDGVPHGWPEGVALGLHRTVAGMSDRTGFAIYVADANGGEAKEILRSTEALRVAGAEALAGGFNLAAMSTDETLVCLEHCEHGDLIHPALRVIDAATGATVGDLQDEGLALHAAAWSPVAGDQRLAIVHERDGEDRPAIWDLATGERTDLRLDLASPGLTEVVDWWPGGSALLLVHLHQGRDRLYRCELPTGDLTPIEHPEGAIWGGRVRPDGGVWFRHTAGHRDARVLSERGEEVVAPDGPRAPEGSPYRAWFFANQHGQQVHGFYVTPEGEPPFPLLIQVHGGPTWLDVDRFDPDLQSFVDMGFAVAMVNYRGSTGYGREWRDALIGDVGGPEIEDVLAGFDDLVARGIADASRAVIAGWSWGGYITLLMIGKHPDRFVSAIAGVPVGDYVASYDDSSPLLQAYDRALLGAPPSELPELMADRSPINFVDRVKVPLLVLAGENDSRCPIRQIRYYTDRLTARGHDLELYLYATGHLSYVVDEQVRQARRALEFLARTVPGVSMPR